MFIKTSVQADGHMHKKQANIKAYKIDTTITNITRVIPQP